MDREKVESSAITSVGYDPMSEILEIEFPSEAVWQYLGVPEDEFDRMMSANSIGQYFHANIRGTYQENRIV